MPNERNLELARGIALNWAKNMTIAANGGPLESLKSMFADVCYIVLQNSEGREVEFTLGDSVDCTMTWDQFTKFAFADLESQNYDCTTSSCLGVLGNKMILETGRLNKDGELYMVATSLLEFDEDGNVMGFESFNPLDIDGAVEAVTDKTF
ncbi:hypothetical protein IV203_019888 [Nitzschia inconspicua]|uniref:Uncharacterized protein n=1 Tax=Nitzschia inconspicua TaxID=303405 RepID=A0A9K3LZB1_9STRA|nr:hypothetical protein IV203_019888 [Nitzschia inconspicua]